MAQTRVLVVEDSATVRERLCSVLAADPEIDLVCTARDGRQAIDFCRTHRPDVITMDMMLPVMNGLAATQYIMAHCPTPILVVSSSFNRGEIFRTYDALAAGAVDVLEKPSGHEPEGDWEQRFLSALKIVSRIRVVTRPPARSKTCASTDTPRVSRPAKRIEPSRALAIAAIGTSTGGPKAVVEIIRALPRDFSTPVLLVLHLNPLFGFAFADWLDEQSERHAAFARDGESVADAAGRILMAPPGKHMIVRDGRIHLHTDPERFSCRPSIDVLFESIAREYGPSSAACLLTGMGRDGARGLLAIRAAGGMTIAQDEATCVVFGMPQEAARLGAAIQILPLDEIGPALAALERNTRKEKS